MISEIDRVSETTKFNEIYLLKGAESTTETGSTGTTTAAAATKKTVTLNADTIKAMEGGISVVVGKNAYAKGSKTAVTGDTADVAESVSLKTGAKLFAGTQGETDGTLEAVDDTNIGTYLTVDADGNLGIADGVTLKTGGSLAAVNADVAGATTVAEGDLGTYATGTAAVKGASGTLNDYIEVVNGEIKYKDGAMLYSAAADDTTEFGLQKEDTMIAEADLADETNGYFKIEGKMIYKDDQGTEALAADEDLSEYFDEYGVYIKPLYTKNTAGDVTEIGADRVKDFFDIKDADGSADADSTSSAAAPALEFNLHVGAEGGAMTDAKAIANKITVKIEAMSAKGIGVDGLKGSGVKTEEAATASIETIKAAIKKVSQQRSDLGAVQNRLEHTINNLDNIVENTQSAESAIRDTDMATEMVKYANNNILAQAGQAMLAQANQANQGVLSLLG
ncbi:MAG: hypothetical protein NC420_13140 [Eubacterium sp.]|nr:hypothetical protein [Eubacterium sp.]